MKFHDLFIQNFLSLERANVNLEDRGLQLVQGVNDIDSSASSNGAGKSSMVDAICWCLYGVTARDVKGDEVVNRAAKKDCMVSLTMSNGASTYKVTRHRKHTTGKNSLVLEACADASTVEGVDLSRGTDTETQKVLEKLLGCSQEVFMAAVYSGQEAMPDLPKMKDRELKSLIEEAAGLQRIEQAYELARERFNAVKGDVNGIMMLQSTVESNRVRAEMALGEVREKFELWEDFKGTRVRDSEAIFEKAKADVTDALMDVEALRPIYDAHVLAIKGIDEKLADHARLETAAVTAERAVRSAELAIDAGLLKRLAADVEKHKARVANAAEEIKKPCSQCGTVLESMSIEDFITHENKHLEAAVNRLETGKVVLRSQMAKLLAVRAAAAAARAAVPDVTALVTVRAEAVRETMRFTAAQTTATRLTNDTEAAAGQVVLRKTEPNPNQSALTLAEKTLREAVDRQAAGVTALKIAQDKLVIATAVVKVFGPAGVRAQILDSVTPFLNAQTNDYLSALSDGEITAIWTTLTKSAAGDLKEKFSIDVTHAKGGDSFKALSGGEKRKVRLATGLALQDLMASRATQPIDLWIGDEIDDALDPAGLERLMTILERKARERGTVLVISHSDLKDWCDNVTTVRKAAQWKSTIEGALVCS